MFDRLLLIDDSEADLLYSSIIIERAGIAKELLACESAAQALALLAAADADRIGLILLDINMPGMNGFEFLEALARRPPPTTRRPVVVMLTSSPDPADRERALASPGVRGYITKPIDIAAARALWRDFGGA